MSITTVDRLDDHALTVELTRLAGCEREATVALVAHLAEFDARRLYEGEGFSSLFMYGRPSCGCPRMRRTTGSRPLAPREGFRPSSNDWRPAA
jgi:hypothetical protein